MRSRSAILFDKSTAAMLVAVQAYNQPSSSYREETFAVLAVNSWELLLKARILQLSNNRIGAILEFEKRRRADGTLSSKLYRKKNRSGNQLSIGLFKALDTLINEYGETIPAEVRSNLLLLAEIRDNSIHFFNGGPELGEAVLEVGTSAVLNHVVLSRRWFGADLTQHNTYLMPIAFVRAPVRADGLALNGQEKQLLDYIANVRCSTADALGGDFATAVEVDIQLKRKSGESLTAVRVTHDGGAAPVRIEEESVLARYPWDYEILTKRLSLRYIDFAANAKYHEIRKSLYGDHALCKERLLDPGKPDGTKKRFFSPNIVRQFDKHYTRRPIEVG